MGRGERFGRRSIRLKGYDNARDGAYFVTICTPGAQLWQRNYHERVIRNSLALNALRRYIVNNPVLSVPD
jgi:hypothetical protein